ncbi:MAG: HD domain-containing protein, partial [Clostridia bacterium]|nr:HD domain-containing protein [Clostridia bacterium]
IKVESFFLLLLALGLLAAYFTINKYVLKPLQKMKNAAIEMKSGSGAFRLDVQGSCEVTEIACAFNDMAVNLENTYKKLAEQTTEIYDRNWELQEANNQLEASYGQLQAMIEQLNEAEQKYHSLVSNLPEIVCVIEETGTISFVNEMCIDILGFERSELVGKNIFSLINSRKARRFSFEEVLEKIEEKGAATLELPLVRKDGDTIITESKLTRYIVNGVQMGYQAIVRDITQKRMMEEEIVQNNRDLSLMNAVSKSLTSTLDMEDLLQLIVGKVTTEINFPASILRMIDRTGTYFEAKAISGSFFEGAEEAIDFETIETKDSIMKQVLNNNETIRITEIPGDWIVGRLNKQKDESERIKEVLLVPLSVKNKKFGVLSACSTSTIKPREAELISAIANYASVAIDNALMYETSRKYFIRTIDCLIAAVEAKDSYTEGHSQRVSKYAVQIATKLGLSKEQIEDIKIAGILHDIGKIGISDSILLKPSKLTEEEYEVVKQHPAISNKILYPVGFSDRTLKAIAFHHERYDGKGYPFGLSGEDITIEAQIISVADAYDAMTSNRSYRYSLGKEDAIKEILANRGTQFNAVVVDAFAEISELLEQAS